MRTMIVLAIARGINYFRGGPNISEIFGPGGPNIMGVQIGLCDNDKTYISITPPKLISINDIISIIFLHTI